MNTYRTKFVTFRASRYFRGRARHDDVRAVVDEGGDVGRFYFAKCNGFFRDAQGVHYVALQWYDQRNNDVVDPTVGLPRLTLKNPDLRASHSILPATSITNGALLIGLNTWHFAVMPPAELARFVDNKGLA